MIKSRWCMVRLVEGELLYPIQHLGFDDAHAACEGVGELCWFAHPLIEY